MVRGEVRWPARATTPLRASGPRWQRVDVPGMDVLLAADRRGNDQGRQQRRRPGLGATPFDDRSREAVHAVKLMTEARAPAMAVLRRLRVVPSQSAYGMNRRGLRRG